PIVDHNKRGVEPLEACPAMPCNFTSPDCHRWRLSENIEHARDFANLIRAQPAPTTQLAPLGSTKSFRIRWPTMKKNEKADPQSDKRDLFRANNHTPDSGRSRRDSRLTRAH